MFKTYHIHINGIVQGVGFRPLIYQVAREMQLNGHVKNGSDGVHILFNASDDQAAAFFNKLKQESPQQSVITSSEMHRIPDRLFTGFSVRVEEDHCEKQVFMTPDNALCSHCREELHDSNNHRYRYPFITCTHCGPRYSIIKELPYERHSTSMQQFSLCGTCALEYNTISDRRFFSQTNSCETCGVHLSIRDNSLSVIADDSATSLLYIQKFLRNGKIIAVKGIGGYLLLCDALNADTVQLLRNRKRRSRKPFALLYPDKKTIERDFHLHEKEEALLEGIEAPIVLLYPKNQADNHLAKQNIAPDLLRLGVMLPYNPLLDLISKDYGKPLIATSANISGSPIIYKDGEAMAYLFSIADYVVIHDREITIPQDDSVVQVSAQTGTQILLRRSRGYAPSFLQYQPQKNIPVLATGAFLKSSFTGSVNNTFFVSQFLGSGESYESQQMYKSTLQNWLNLYQVKPEVIITDSHPGYFSHQYARELSEKYLSDIQFVQHHEAHFAAVLAENGLIKSADQPVLGVIWDGTGLGHDGNIWGGEFFVYDNKEMLRCYHFDYFPVIAGDKPALEPRMAALCVTHNSWPGYDSIQNKFSVAEWNNYQALLIATKLFSSSVGRIFDAVASLLNLCDKQTYEGEAALLLQVLAEEFTVANGLEMDSSYFIDGAHYNRIPTASLMQRVIEDIKNGKDKKYIAAKFHYSLACLIGIVAKNMNTLSICFSGGVFQNALLVDWIKKLYGHTHTLYFHTHLSPNDENISFGQFVYYDNDIRTKHPTELLHKKNKTNLQAADALAIPQL